MCHRHFEPFKIQIFFGLSDELVNGCGECWGMVDDKEDLFVSVLLLTSFFLFVGWCLFGLCPVMDLFHCWWLALN